MAFWIMLLIAALLIAAILLQSYFKNAKRKRISDRPFPKNWREILRRNLPIFYRIPADLQLQLKNKIKIFIAEKEFIGCEGIEINDEIKVTIAAQACILLLNRDTDYFPKLRSVLIYPAAFITRHQQSGPGGVLQQNNRVLSGESWETGQVILSWRDTVHGGKDPDDGHNVVIHEFAHQLDQETGYANGAPGLKNKQNKKWPEVFNQAFEDLRRDISLGHPTLLDRYGATNPAEFFAVASEVFFEKPDALKAQQPALYEQLAVFYNLDPANW